MVARVEKIYAGHIDPDDDSRTVTVNANPLPRVDTMPGDREYSWGYDGTGPQILADAITHDLIGSVLDPYRNIVLDLITNLEEDSPFTLTATQIGQAIQGLAPASAWDAVKHLFP